MPNINWYNSLMLDSINYSYLQGKGHYMNASPVGINVIRPIGLELYAEVVIQYPHRPFHAWFFFNSEQTDEEIQNELKEFNHLTNGYNYKVI